MATENRGHHALGDAAARQLANATKTVPQLVLTAYAYKLAVALLATPIVYLVHAGVERYLGRERAQAMRDAALRMRDEQ